MRRGDEGVKSLGSGGASAGDDPVDMFVGGFLVPGLVIPRTEQGLGCSSRGK